MPHVEYVQDVPFSREVIWGFVKSMDNWAPFLVGYQSHVMDGEMDSVWRIKGDLGPMSRLVELSVHITEWNGPEVVRFDLKGINEAVSGHGMLRMTEHSSQAILVEPVAAKPRWLSRLWTKLVYWLLGWHRHDVKRVSKTTDCDAKQLFMRTRMVFSLSLEAAGPTGPMVNALLEPLLHPMAEQLSGRIAERLIQIDTEQGAELHSSDAGILSIAL